MRPDSSEIRLRTACVPALNSLLTGPRSIFYFCSASFGALAGRACGCAGAGLGSTLLFEKFPSQQLLIRAGIFKLLKVPIVLAARPPPPSPPPRCCRTARAAYGDPVPLLPQPPGPRQPARAPGLGFRQGVLCVHAVAMPASGGSRRPGPGSTSGACPGSGPRGPRRPLCARQRIGPAGPGPPKCVRWRGAGRGGGEARHVQVSSSRGHLKRTAGSSRAQHTWRTACFERRSAEQARRQTGPGGAARANKRRAECSTFSALARPSAVWRRKMAVAERQSATGTLG